MQRAFDAIIKDMIDGISVERSCKVLEKPSILLAVSGGIDSMCMAELFRRSSVQAGFAVAHCNFALRGEDSDMDEASVAAWTEANGIRLHRMRFDTEAYADRNGVSIEMAARDLRYGWFAELCARYGYKAVAVAHNMNDNVETLFLNLLRGTGIRGLAGMRPVSPLPLSDASGHAGPDSCRLWQKSESGAVVIRPLLTFTRKQIEGYVFSHHVAYRDDRTNAGTEYKRNKLRNLVFPLFEEINPSFIRTVGREMSYFAQMDGIADEYCRRVSGDIVNEGRHVDLKRLMNDPNWEYVLYRILDDCGFSSSAISSLSDLLKSGRTIAGKEFFSGGYRLVTTSDALLLENISVRKEELEAPAYPSLRSRGTLPDTGFGTLKSSEPVMVVQGVGNYVFNGVFFSVETDMWESGSDVKMPEGVQIFDKASFDFPFVCRRWMKGDWMIPLGMKGRKKISDLFTDLKYSLIDKEKAVVLVNPSLPGAGSGRVSGDENHRVCAVLGVRTDDRGKIRESTKEIIRITLE